MRNTISKGFEHGFLYGLAGVNKRRSRKQVLKSIVDESASSIDMAKGLQGRGDWHGAAAKIVNAASLLGQAIDLAETLPGVEFSKTRKQTELVIKRLGDASAVLDSDTLKSREIISACEDALQKAVDVLGLFSDSLNDDVLTKDSAAITFNENALISKLKK